MWILTALPLAVSDAGDHTWLKKKKKKKILKLSQTQMTNKIETPQFLSSAHTMHFISTSS